LIIGKLKKSRKKEKYLPSVEPYFIVASSHMNLILQELIILTFNLEMRKKV